MMLFIKNNKGKFTLITFFSRCANILCIALLNIIYNLIIIWLFSRDRPLNLDFKNCNNDIMEHKFPCFVEEVCLASACVFQDVSKKYPPRYILILFISRWFPSATGHWQIKGPSVPSLYVRVSFGANVLNNGRHFWQQLFKKKILFPRLQLSFIDLFGILFPHSTLNRCPYSYTFIEKLASSYIWCSRLSISVDVGFWTFLCIIQNFLPLCVFMKSFFFFHFTLLQNLYQWDTGEGHLVFYLYIYIIFFSSFLCITSEQHLLQQVVYLGQAAELNELELFDHLPGDALQGRQQE